MTVQEIKKIIIHYNLYDRKYPVSSSFAEHADSDDWDRYWDKVAQCIAKEMEAD